MKLRNVNIGDSQFLYDLLAEREDHQNISHKKMPIWEGHIAFIKSNPYKEWFVINENMGVVYITQLNEVGLQIKKEFQRKGLGSEVLKHLRKTYPKLLFNVNPDNQKAINFLNKNGINKIIQVTYAQF